MNTRETDPRDGASHGLLRDVFFPFDWSGLAARASTWLLGPSGDRAAADLRAPGARETEQARKLRLWFAARNRGEL